MYSKKFYTACYSEFANLVGINDYVSNYRDKILQCMTTPKSWLEYTTMQHVRAGLNIQLTSKSEKLIIIKRNARPNNNQLQTCVITYTLEYLQYQMNTTYNTTI